MKIIFVDIFDLCLCVHFDSKDGAAGHLLTGTKFQIISIQHWQMFFDRPLPSGVEYFGSDMQSMFDHVEIEIKIVFY